MTCEENAGLIPAAGGGVREAKARFAEYFQSTLRGKGGEGLEAFLTYLKEHVPFS